MDYFFDSSVIVELVLGNEEYLRFRELTIITSTLHMAEVYYFLLKKYNEKTADYWIKRLDFKLINMIKLEDSINAAKFKFKNNKDNLSYADCIGYIISKKLNMKFLTRDSKFKGRENVEFLKD